LFKGRFSRDFLGGPVIKSPHSYAGDVGSILDPETKSEHAAEQLTAPPSPPRPTSQPPALQGEKA